MVTHDVGEGGERIQCTFVYTQNHASWSQSIRNGEVRILQLDALTLEMMVSASSRFLAL